MTSVPFAIRRAAPGDAAAVAAHRVGMFRDMGRVQDGALADALRAAAEETLRAWLAAGTYLGWLAAPADRPGEIVGGAGLQLRPMLPRPDPEGRTLIVGPEAYVLNVFVERAWRRQGVAARLMDEVLRWTREDGRRVVTLHASSEGRPLYERLGFAPTNELRLR